MENTLNKLYKMNRDELLKILQEETDGFTEQSRLRDDVLDALEKVQELAINYNRCCTELNPEFEIGEQVLLTKRTVVTVETFCEDGMIEIDDNNEYYKVDKGELSKRV